MNTKSLQNGFSLPELGLGTWKIGGEREADTSRDNDWIRSIEEAIEIGYRHIDTAEMYGAGHAEELIGQSIAVIPREELKIASKVFATNLAYDDIKKSFFASLKRLNLGYLDLYYIHAPSEDIPLKETMRAFDELVDEGLVKNIGVSNFTTELLEEAQSYSRNKIVANQIEYNLVTREQSNYGGCSKMESEILPYCQANDILVVAYRPLDRGIVLEKNQVMDEMSQKYGKTYSQIAINWLISQQNIVAIVKSSKGAHLEEDMGGTGWNLDTEDVERLRREYPAKA
ncbi:MAG: hypothetical protein JWN64_535 [Parcubacteria group bacterium]|nr:hypothetical protein [Parcubacteria group bacterium]